MGLVCGLVRLAGIFQDEVVSCWSVRVRSAVANVLVRSVRKLVQDWMLVR